MVKEQLKGEVLIPPPLSLSDEIRIVSPAGCIAKEYLDGAKQVLETWGLRVSEGKYAGGSYGRFSGTKEERIADLQTALDDPRVQAILCSRGGYGLAQIADALDLSAFCRKPKWLIGFSDITVLHSLLTSRNIASIHGIMAKHLSELSAEDESVKGLRNILWGARPSYHIPAQSTNREGEARGILKGGNLSVLMGLRGSDFDLHPEGSILFIEDVGEKPYQVDRMMQNLRLSGILKKLSGVIVGHFSDYEEDASMRQNLKEIIAEAASECPGPICFGFPAGHENNNLPLILGTNVELKVEASGAQLRF